MSEITPATSPGSGTTVPGPGRRTPLPAAGVRRGVLPRHVGTGLGLGSATIYLSLIVLIPLGAVVWKSNTNGPAAFWDAVAHARRVVGAQAHPGGLARSWR